MTTAGVITLSVLGHNEFKADKARLDFLEAHQCCVLPAYKPDSQAKRWVCRVPSRDKENNNRSFFAASPHAAIDQVIEKLKEGT